MGDLVARNATQRGREGLGPVGGRLGQGDQTREKLEQSARLSVSCRGLSDPETQADCRANPCDFRRGRTRAGPRPGPPTSLGTHTWLHTPGRSGTGRGSGARTTCTVLSGRLVCDAGDSFSTPASLVVIWALAISSGQRHSSLDRKPPVSLLAEDEVRANDHEMRFRNRRGRERMELWNGRR